MNAPSFFVVPFVILTDSSYMGLGLLVGYVLYKAVRFIERIAKADKEVLQKFGFADGVAWRGKTRGKMC